MRRLVRSLLIWGILLILLAACGDGQGADTNDEDENNLMIYTTIYPLAFLAEEIGQDFVRVESILPAGSDAHTFEPTSRMMVEIAEADLFIFNDEISESYAKKIKDALKNERVDFLEASKGLERLKYHHGDDHVHDGDDHDHDHGDYDPHVWISPELMVELGENIAVKLTELMPEEEDAFQANLASITDQLEDLDEKFADAVDQFSRKTILVTHAAYGYWEAEYGLEQIAITGLSASEEPSQRQLANLLERVEELDLDYLLFDQNIQPRVATVIQEEAGLTSLVIHNLEVLTEADISADENYLTLMERNIAVLTEALK